MSCLRLSPAGAGEGPGCGSFHHRAPPRCRPGGSSNTLSGLASSFRPSCSEHLCWAQRNWLFWFREFRGLKQKSLNLTLSPDPQWRGWARRAPAAQSRCGEGGVRGRGRSQTESKEGSRGRGSFAACVSSPCPCFCFKQPGPGICGVSRVWPLPPFQTRTPGREGLSSVSLFVDVGSPGPHGKARLSGTRSTLVSTGPGVLRLGSPGSSSHSRTLGMNASFWVPHRPMNLESGGRAAFRI